MTTLTEFARRRAKPLVAIGLVAGLYGFARLPELPDAERARLAARFSFTRLTLPEVTTGPSSRFVRAVHPGLARISAWISAVGAAVALNDLDGDGLPNDVCHVDTRTDQVIVAPVPGTPERYRPFALDPAPLPYDPGSMAPMGCLPGDLNEDGLMDLYTGNFPGDITRRTADGGVMPGTRTRPPAIARFWEKS